MSKNDDLKQFLNKLNENKRYKRVSFGGQFGWIRLVINRVEIREGRVYLYKRKELLGYLALDKISEVAVYENKKQKRAV